MGTGVMVGEVPIAEDHREREGVRIQLCSGPVCLRK